MNIVHVDNQISTSTEHTTHLLDIVWGITYQTHLITLVD